ncbi:MAG: tetratricopeptide repeat protein [Promethearchaeota archaeon]
MNDIQLFETFHGKIADLFRPENYFTFLAGAGISMDAPTNMPSAREIVKSLLGFCGPPDELENILSLDLLRYELVVEKIQSIFDEELKFMDYLELITSPNIIHLFLAHLIKKGHYVITTNFDYLIEHALINVLPKNQHFSIYPIITKEDFLSFREPRRLIETEKYPIFKIHGSKRNIITGESTHESLITTISALGREREEGETFAIEPYKKPAIYNLMKDRTLVIMGYSGSDDFDIGPMLKELPFLSRLIWIEHSFDDQIKIMKVNKTNNLTSKAHLSHSERLLAEISVSGDFDVFLIKSNTANIIKNELWKILLSNISINHLKLTESVNKIPVFHEWVKLLYQDLPLAEKYNLACQIFYFLKQIDATVRCSEKGKSLAESVNDIASKSIFLNFLGMVNLIRGDYNKALENYNESLLIDEKLENLSGKTIDLNNIGSVYLTLGKYDEALEKYENALKISNQIGDLSGMTADLNNIGRIYEIRGEYDLALKRYEEALRNSEQLGDLGLKSTLLNNIGMIHGARANFDKALKNYEEALHIVDQLGDLYGKIILLNNIGRIYDEHQNYDAAMEKYEETILIAEQLGDLAKKAGCLNNVGSVYRAKGNLEEAIKKYEEALQIEERLGDPLMKIIYLNNIGMIYASRGEFNNALEKYKIGLTIAEEIGDFSKVALLSTKIGSIYLQMEDITVALENYENAVKLYEQAGDLANKAASLSNLGKIFEIQNNYEKALDIYKETLQIDDQIGDSMSKASDLNNIGKIYEFQGRFNEAVKIYEEILEILQQKGQEDYIEMFKEKIEQLKEKLKE